MTELIFFSKPILLLVPVVFGLLQILLFRLPKTAALLINAILFTVCVVLLILLGGQLSDILATALFAALLSFIFSETPKMKTSGSGKEDDEK